MRIEAKSPEQFSNQLPDARKEALLKLREVIKENLPLGFTEIVNYDMIGYVVPHSLYPPGYYNNPKLPLPFMSMSLQKNYVTFYHMGIFVDKNLTDWFINEYHKHSRYKLDMGMSCIRFKKADRIPYELIGELAGKLSFREWIKIYENNIKR